MFGVLRRSFASKVSADQVRLLRDMTGAPLLQCKNILTECEGDLDKAKTILREKNLIFADKKAGALTNQGLWGMAFTPNRKRGVLVNLNSETDFVAKGEVFREFLGNTLKLLLGQQENFDLKKGDSHLEGLLKDTKYDSANTLEEAKKILTAKTKENIEFSEVRAFTAGPEEVIGGYVHKQLEESLGSSGCWMVLQHDLKGRYC